MVSHLRNLLALGLLVIAAAAGVCACGADGVQDDDTCTMQGVAQSKRSCPEETDLWVCQDGESFEGCVGLTGVGLCCIGTESCEEVSNQLHDATRRKCPDADAGPGATEPLSCSRQEKQALECLLQCVERFGCDSDDAGHCFSGCE